MDNFGKSQVCCYTNEELCRKEKVDTQPSCTLMVSGQYMFVTEEDTHYNDCGY